MAKINFLVIVTYRKEEVSDAVSNLLNNDGAVVSYVQLENLDQQALMDLVRTCMHRHRDIDTVLLAPLVDFIYQKTRGNPFYANQLLATLVKKGFIYFTWEQGRWEYNLQEIEKALLNEMGEKNADIDVEFLVRRLKELPRDGRRFLKWASFLGNNFSFETVRHLMLDCENEEIDSDNEGDEDFSPASTSPFKEGGPFDMTRQVDAINGLQSALQQGFIEAFSNDEFGFSHDRYSQAAMMLAKPERREMLHLKIALHFMDKTSNVDSFWVADHLKAAIRLIKAFDRKARHRAVLVQAGDKAYASGAHGLAYSYYAGAEELLSTNAWTDGYDSKYQETLHIYTRLAEVSWFIGSDVTPKLLATIFKNAKSAIDRAAAYRIQHRYYFSRKEHQKESTTLLECLAELGLDSLELDLSDEQLRQVYEATRDEVLKVGLEKLSDLPVCDDRLIRTRLSILEEICLWAFWMSDNKAILSAGAAFVQKTLKDGATPTTGVGFVFFGVAAMQLFKAYEFGQQIGEVGISLCDKYGGNSESARARCLYGSFLSSWKYHYRDSLPMFRQSLKQSLLGGDRIYATFSHLYIVMNMFLCGEHMSDTLREAKLCLDELTSWSGSVGASALVTSVIRTILAFQGKTYLTEHGIFDDKDFEESSFVVEIYQQNPDSGLPIYWHFALKLITLVLYGYDEVAYRIGREYTQLADMQPAHRHTHLMLFFHCLAMVRLVRGGKGNQESYLEIVRTHRNTLYEWAQHS